MKSKSSNDLQGGKLLLRPKEVAHLLSISLSHVYEQLANGTLDSVRIGRCVRIDVEDLHDFIANSRHGSATGGAMQSEDS
jgi:excisionase family DNA binding protein